MADLHIDIVDLAQITLCERDQRALHTEINQNLEVLFRLRHPTVVGGDNQKCEID